MGILPEIINRNSFGAQNEGFISLVLSSREGILINGQFDTIECHGDEKLNCMPVFARSFSDCLNM